MLPFNKLYQLIRNHAGTKMLREAEEILTYNKVQYLLEENMPDHAIKAIETHNIDYESFTKYEPMRLLTLEQVKAINAYDLELIPWIYVHMLETLSQDEEVAPLVAEMIRGSPAAAWRVPLEPSVNYGDAFSDVYSNWLQKNYHWMNPVRRWAKV